MKLIQDLREFIELLTSENVRYVVIGDWAYNRYAEPRITGDIDFFVSTDQDNQRKLRRVLEEFGFGDSLPAETAPLFKKKMLMIGRPPNRIDLISEIDGVSFEEAWNEKEPGVLDGLPVLFISRSLLIRNKKATGRAKDLLDATTLEQYE